MKYNNSVPAHELTRTQFVCWIVLLRLQCFKALETSKDTDD